MAEYINKNQLMDLLMDVEMNYTYYAPNFNGMSSSSDSIDGILKNIIEQAITDANRQLLQDIQSEISKVEGRDLCILCKEQPDDQ